MIMVRCLQDKTERTKEASSPDEPEAGTAQGSQLSSQSSQPSENFSLFLEETSSQDEKVSILTNLIWHEWDLI